MTTEPLRCEECDRPWDDAGEPWRAEWVDDEVGVGVWCPTCWTREFGSVAQD